MAAKTPRATTPSMSSIPDAILRRAESVMCVDWVGSVVVDS